MENKEENKTVQTQSKQVGTGDHWDTIAKVGRFQDSSGKWHNFTEAEFDEIIKNFKPGEVPVVLGHPKTNSPAYGWVSELRRDGEWLQAKYSDLSDQLVEMLKRKLYKYKSMALNGLKLRHVGFLGAANPAIPGLGPVHFNSAEDICCFEFNESPAMAPPWSRSSPDSISTGWTNIRVTYCWWPSIMTKRTRPTSAGLRSL